MPAPRGVFVLLVSFMIATASIASAQPPGFAAAVAAWPPSAGLVVAEVVTGGASASDEYVEIANAGSDTADANGLELIYVTASGATTTRKAAFGATLGIVPGGHLLVANAAGIYAPLADATYTGGLAADGGVVALRRADGTVVDAVGWGTAANAYVEGSAAPAPPAKSSIERLPGGSAGNTQDTNDNRTDWFVQSSPIPQSLVSAPAPGRSAAPSTSTTPAGGQSSSSTDPSTSGSPTSGPPATDPPATDPPATGVPTPQPSVSALDTSTPTPAASVPEPSAVWTPSAEVSAPPASATPTSTASTPASTANPTPSPATTPGPGASSTPSAVAPPGPTAAASPSSAPPSVAPSASPTRPIPALESIAAARAQAAGTRVNVAGVVTVGPGLVGAAALFVIRDATGGIFVRLSTSSAELSIGLPVEVAGTLSAPYGQLEIRDLEYLTVGTDTKEPAAAAAGLGEIGEGTEGSLVMIRGTVESVQTDSGRLTITISDATGTVRLLADPPAGLSSSDVVRGDFVLATGIVGQHATATGRLDGYRVWVRRRADVVALAPISTSTPSPISTRSSAASSQPTATPVHHDLASALGTRAAAVDVEATVSATAGLLDIGGPTIVVDDGTAAVAVLLPDGAGIPPVGMRVRVTGKVGRWEGGPTVLATGVSVLGELQAVGPQVVARPLDASLEWHLVRVCGRVEKFTPAGSRWRLDLNVSGNEVAVLGEPAASISVTTTSVGRLVLVVGVVRRSTSNSSAFQLLPRSRLDFVLGPAASASGSAAAGSAASGSAAASAGGSGADWNAVNSEPGAAGAAVPIESLTAFLGRNVTIAGLVTDTTGRTATVEDGSGAVRVGGDPAAEAVALLEPGDGIEVSGLVEQDEDGLIIEADPASIVDLPGGGAAAPASGSAKGSAEAVTSTKLPIGASSPRPTGTPRPTASVAAAASMRRAAPGGAVPDPAVLLAVLTIALATVAASLAIAGRTGRFRRLRCAGRLGRPHLGRRKAG